jgi:hypothetical protein
LASTPTLAQSQPYSHPHRHGSSYDWVNQHGDDETTGSASDELAPHTLPQPLDENEGGSDENASELERGMQLAFEEQEKSSSAPAPNSPRPQRPSAEPPHPQIERGEEAQEQRQREVAAEDGSGSDGEPEPEERGEKRLHLDENNKIGSDRHHPKGSDCSHNTDDEDPRPAKRRKLSPTDNALTLPDEPTPVDNGYHHTSRTSRSPSITVESAPVAEYQEWPFQGFLKRTKIGNKTTYNLEFQLPRVPEHLHSEALGMRSDKETSAEATTPHDASAHSKMYPAAGRQIKRVRWTPEEDATILKIRKEDGCSWEEIHDVLPHRSIGTIQVHYSTKLKG